MFARCHVVRVGSHLRSVTHGVLFQRRCRGESSSAERSLCLAMHLPAHGEPTTPADDDSGEGSAARCAGGGATRCSELGHTTHLGNRKLRTKLHGPLRRRAPTQKRVPMSTARSVCDRRDDLRRIAHRRSCARKWQRQSFNVYSHCASLPSTRMISTRHHATLSAVCGRKATLAIAGLAATTATICQPRPLNAVVSSLSPCTGTRNSWVHANRGKHRVNRLSRGGLLVWQSGLCGA